MKVFLSICDYCCDNAGLAKEVFKTGGCTCEICGWSCHCALNTKSNFVNSVRKDLITDENWNILEITKHRFDNFDIF